MTARMCNGRWIAAMCFLLLAFADRTLLAQWVEMDLPRAPHFRQVSGAWENLGPLAWADSLTGYVFERNGVFYKTTDGGDSWHRDSLDVEGMRTGRGFNVLQCDFPTPQFGVVTFGGGDAYLRSDSIMFVTTDGGRQWIRRSIDAPNLFRQTGTRLIPLRNGNLIFCYGRILFSPDSPYAIVDEVMSRSTDLGESWEVFSADTLDFRVDWAWTWNWIYVDSLHAYRFTLETMTENPISYVKATSDGGRSWEILSYPHHHPLSAAKVASRFPLNIKRVNDTGLVVAMGWTSSPYSRSFGMVTRDARYHDIDEGWIRVDADPRPFAEQIVDMSYIDGRLFYLSYRLNNQDTLWVTNLAGSGVRYPFQIPVKLVVLTRYTELLTPTPERIFLWMHRGVWRLDWRLVELREPPPAPSQGIELYPHPMDLRSHAGLTIRAGAGRANAAARLSVRDLLGRELLSTPVVFRDGLAHVPARHFLSSRAAPGLHTLALSFDRDRVFIKPFLLY